LLFRNLLASTKPQKASYSTEIQCFTAINSIGFKPGTQFHNFIFEIIFVNSLISKIIKKCFCLILKNHLINLNFKILYSKVQNAGNY
jgi:hypothetical protein